MRDKEIMQMALDALLRVWHSERNIKHSEAIDAIRARLTQPKPAECDGGQCGIGGYCKECPKTQQEPTARDINEVILNSIHDSSEVVAQPQREWQGLTDEELLDIADMAYANDLELLQTLQAKLKEKNHG